MQHLEVFPCLGLPLLVVRVRPHRLWLLEVTHLHLIVVIEDLDRLLSPSCHTLDKQH